MRQSCARRCLNIHFLFNVSLVMSSRAITHDAQLQLFLASTITGIVRVHCESSWCETQSETTDKGL